MAEDAKKELYHIYQELERRTGLVNVHIQDLLGIVSKELAQIPASLFQEGIEESDEFKRLKVNLSKDLEAYKLEIYRLFDAKVHEHKKKSEEYL